jgi:hypothetical protein
MDERRTALAAAVVPAKLGEFCQTGRRGYIAVDT